MIKYKSSGMNSGITDYEIGPDYILYNSTMEANISTLT